MYWASFLVLKMSFAVNNKYENAIFEDFKSSINPILLDFLNTSSGFCYDIRAIGRWKQTPLQPLEFCNLFLVKRHNLTCWKVNFYYYHVTSSVICIKGQNNGIVKYFSLKYLPQAKWVFQQKTWLKWIYYIQIQPISYSCMAIHFKDGRYMKRWNKEEFVASELTWW